MSGLRAKFGHETARDAAFNYQLQHCLPSAAAQYDASPHAALLAIYSNPGAKAGGGRFAEPPVQSSALYVEGIAEPMWRRLPLTLTLTNPDP